MLQWKGVMSVPPFFDLIVIAIVGLAVLSMAGRRRPGGSTLLDRIRREVQDAVRSAQGIPTPTGMAQVRPPKKPAAKKDVQDKAEPIQSSGWRGTENKAAPTIKGTPKQTVRPPVNPFPVVSNNPLVQAVVISEILARPKGTKPGR